MPRTNVPVQDLASGGNSELTETACDKTNDHEFLNDGKTVLLIENESTATMAVTVHAVSCSHGREVDDTASILDGEAYKFGPYPPSEWNQTDGVVHVDIDQDTTSFIRAIRLPG